jgi:hypothetical protein
LRHRIVADEESREDGSNQHESYWRSPAATRVAATSNWVDQFYDNFAWCEAIGHRSIPRYCTSVSVMAREASEKSAAADVQLPVQSHGG